MPTVYTYHVKAYTSDPKSEGGHFTYDSTVDRDAPLNSGEEFDVLLKGLAEHFHAKTGVRVVEGAFVLQRVELLGAREKCIALDAIDSSERDMKEAFEAKYQRDWEDPAGNEMKAIWADAWVSAKLAV